MIASDVIRRFECRQSMIERERNEYQGKLPSVHTKSGKWGTFKNSSGLKSITLTVHNGRESYAARYYVDREPVYLGRYDNAHSAVDSICKACNITPMQIEGMTKEGWDLIKCQPIIRSRTYKGGN